MCALLLDTRYHSALSIPARNQALGAKHHQAQRCTKDTWCLWHTLVHSCSGSHIAQSTRGCAQEQPCTWGLRSPQGIYECPPLLSLPCTQYLGNNCPCIGCSDLLPGRGIFLVSEGEPRSTWQVDQGFKCRKSCLPTWKRSLNLFPGILHYIQKFIRRSPVSGKGHLKP